MSSAMADSTVVLHKRRDASEHGSAEPDDDSESSSASSSLDMSALSDADKAKLRKELASGLVVGQWIIPPVLWAVAASDGGYDYFEKAYLLALLCNGLLIMAVGYLVQGRIEHWHVRPTIVWLALPLLFQLIRYEPFMFAILLLVVSIPFVIVFATWCTRYGFENTCRMGLQHIQRCFTFEGMFSRRLVTLTKRYIYDMDALYDEDDPKLGAAEKGTNSAIEDIEEKHSPEDLARIRANTERHLRPYIRGLVLLVLWGAWWICYSSHMVAPCSGLVESKLDLDTSLPIVPNFGYRAQPPLQDDESYRSYSKPNEDSSYRSYSKPNRLSKSSSSSPGKEIVTITVHKEEGDLLGLGAQPRNGKKGNLVVTRINPDGLLAGTELRPGMEIFGINGVEVSRMSLQQAKKVVREAKGTIQILALKDRVAAGGGRGNEEEGRSVNLDKNANSVLSNIRKVAEQHMVAFAAKELDAKLEGHKSQITTMLQPITEIYFLDDTTLKVEELAFDRLRKRVRKSMQEHVELYIANSSEDIDQIISEKEEEGLTAMEISDILLEYEEEKMEKLQGDIISIVKRLRDDMPLVIPKGVQETMERLFEKLGHSDDIRLKFKSYRLIMEEPQIPVDFNQKEARAAILAVMNESDDANGVGVEQIDRL